MRIVYLLSGPGKTEGFSENIKSYLKKDLKSLKKITFIASSKDNYDKNELFVYGNNDSITGLKNHLSDIMDIKQINILDSRTNLEDGKKIIKDSDVIYLMGGNPFTQIEYINDNGYNFLLKDFQGVILGTSAGAMNLAKYSYYSKDEDYENSLFYKGLEIVDVTIDPHFDINNEEQVNEAKEYSKEHKIIGLPNESAVRIENDDIKYINKCFLFNSGKMEDIN